MPLSYELAPNDPIVIIRGDFADAAEWRAILDEVATRWSHREGAVGILRDRRHAAAPLSRATIIDIVDVIARVWSRMRLVAIAVLTRPLDEFPEPIATALADSRGILLQAFDSEDAAWRWLDAVLRDARHSATPG